MRAAGYVRVSTGKQADKGLSLEEQERQVRDYIERQGWELAALYVERGVSGRKAERPELDRLLSELDGLDAVVIPKLDRLGRSQQHLHAEVFPRLERADVRLVSMQEGFDSGTPQGRMMRGLLATLAEFESEQIAERVRAVTAAKVAEGRWHGGPRPFGYRYAEGGGLVPDVLEAPLVRRIFELAAEGLSQRAIARKLNHEGHRTLSGRQWSQSVVSTLLSNVVYRGDVHVNGQVYPGHHEPLVSRELWDAAASTRELAARRPNNGRGRAAVGRHLFTRGLLRCAHCGSSMYPRTYRRRDGSPTREVYECSGRIRNGTAYCPAKPIPRAPIDAAVFDYFAKVGLDLETTREQLARALDSQLADVREAREAADRQEQQAAARLERVRRDYQDGKLEAEDWSEQRAQLAQELTAAQASAQRLRDQERALEANPALDAEQETLERLAELRAAVAGEVSGAADLDAARLVLAKLFDHFLIGYVQEPESELAAAAMRGAGQPETDVEAEVKGRRYLLLPEPREEVIAGLDGLWQPVLSREPLPLHASDAIGLQT